jgi:uncharacterized membrane protein
MTLDTALAGLLSVLLVTAGALHFVATDLFAQIVPPMLPAPEVIVWLSGVAEIAIGLGLMFRRTRRIAAVLAVALFVAVFPANLYMAMAHLEIRGLPAWLPQPTETGRWMRLPFQALLVGWAIWVARRRSNVGVARAP